MFKEPQEKVIDFQRIFESVPGLYLILAPDLTILTASNAYLEATMTDRNEIIGRGLFDVFPDNPDDGSADGVSNLSSSLQHVLTSGLPHTMAVQKYDIRKPDGLFEVRYWSPINTPVKNEEGEIEYIIHRVEDITAYISFQNQASLKEQEAIGLKQKVNEMEIEIIRRSKEIQKLNEELELKVKQRTESLLAKEIALHSQNKKLIAQNRDMEQFTYIASHDLQEPLRTLIGFTDLIQEKFNGKLGSDGDAYINFISKSSKRMQDLVKGLLDYSRIGIEKQLVELDCNMVVKEVLADMVVSIQEKNAHIIVHDLPRIQGYPEIRLLFQNLLSNAIKFRKKDAAPRVEISSSEKEGSWTFSIRDNGIGIEEANKKKLFTIFKRLNNRDEYEGIGIGLAHCVKIVDLHGGVIWVDANPEGGSTFNFKIPKL